MNKIKVLIAINDMNNGGTESFVMNYYREIDRNKFDISFLILSGKEVYYKNEIENNNDIIYHLSTDNKKYYFYNFFKICCFLKKNKFNIIHINACSLKFMGQIAIAAKIAGVDAIIGHSHSVGEPQNTFKYQFGSFFLKKIIDRIIDFGVACSIDAGKGKFTYKRIKSNRFNIVPNAINCSYYRYNEYNRNLLRSSLNIKDELVLGIVGRLDECKNQTFLIDVIKEINQLISSTLLIIGDGEKRLELELKAKSLGIQDKVIFLGQLSNVNEYYSAMDIFCLPSYAEGFPFVLVEAQANSLKCFASKDITEETNISETVEYLDRHDLNIWCKKIILNKDTRINKEAVEIVLKQYDIKNAVKNLEELYIKALM